MNRSPGFSALALCLILSSSLLSEEVPDGYGQLENVPTIIPGGVDEAGREFVYLGQAAEKRKLIFTASNGFFTGRVATAKGESALPKVGDEDLIVPNFAYLDWTGTEHSLRWHVHIAEPGTVHFAVHLAAANAGSKIDVRFAGETRSVATASSNAEKAQPWDLSFEAAKPGEYEFALEATNVAGNKVGDLYRIDAFGPALTDAHLLRVRWRPAAAHGGYDTGRVGNAKLLVFTTRSVADVSSYSPVTTPFGYYGTSFEADRRTNGSFNFSMWGKEGAASDLKTMPHLLGLGSKEGEFSGFGHEGSGVKPRGWDPMPDRPELVVQALRVESDEEYDTYYGYYFDHPTSSWKFYAAGNKWHGGNPKEHLKLGSFCEVPGPPDRQRTGDVYREVRRRGWAWDGDAWKSLETYLPGGNGSSGNPPVNKLWYTTEEGEYAMGCGGIRLYPHDSSRVTASISSDLPYFLSSSTVANLFTLPIDIGTVQATEVSSDRAVIEFDVPFGENLSAGAVHFGTKDALTFAARELHGTERNSSLSQAIQGMAWENSVPIEQLTTGVNRVSLEGLEPGTEYFYRVLTSNDVSQIWTEESYSFTTPEAGEGAVKQAPLTATPSERNPVVASSPAERYVDGEPVRTWTYQIDGQPRTLEGRLTGIAGDQVQIERKSDGKRGVMPLEILSEADREYVGERR
ncbi:MAG: fibronectin type III domain-containing protein [Verrucomicrobiota bacterium]